MKLHRCDVCHKRIWLSPIRVIIKEVSKDQEYWVHEGCLDKLEVEV